MKAEVSDLKSENERLQKNDEIKEGRLRKILLENQSRTIDYESPASYDLKAEESDMDALDKELGGDLNNSGVENSESYLKLKEENEHLRQQIRDQENSLLQQLENDLIKKDSSLKTSQEDQVRVMKRLEIFEKQNHELKSEIDRLKNEQYGFMEMQNEFKMAKSDRKIAKEKLSKLQAKVKSLEEAKAELEMLKKTHANLEEEKKEMKIEIKETRALLDKHKEENQHLKYQNLEREKETRMFDLLKEELKSYKEGDGNTRSVASSSIEKEMMVVEKDNQILKLKLEIQTLENKYKDNEKQFEDNLRDMERNFVEERGSLHDEIYQANLEKDQIDQSMKEQEKLMMSAMASFYFDTLSKQEAKKQEEKRGEMSFLKRLRNSSYPLSSGY